MPDRVVITGMGVVSCLGGGLPGFWRGLTEARTGIGPISKFDASGIRNPEGGEVHEWDTARLPAWTRSLDEGAQFALTAAQEAMDAAGLPQGDADTGVVLATNFGGAGSFQKWASSQEDPASLALSPRPFRNSLMSTATDAMAALTRASGPRATLSLSCSSGAAAIGLAADWIRRGKVKRVLAGGYDGLTLYCLAGLSCLRTVTTGKLQPFDKNRSGTVFGEGAGIMLLESETAARERGSQPLAILRGQATNNNAHHLTAPQTDGSGLLHVMEATCRDARLNPSAIDYVNAHGTGTRYNDPAETSALHHLLGERAAQVPVSSIKAAISHTMGAAGAIEAIASVMALRHSILPPTLNWQERDPDCDLDYIPNEARAQKISCVLTVSSGIGGNNAALLLEQYT